jgi:hypothetical protein
MTNYKGETEVLSPIFPHDMEKQIANGKEGVQV